MLAILWIGRVAQPSIYRRGRFDMFFQTRYVPLWELDILPAAMRMEEMLRNALNL